MTNAINTQAIDTSANENLASLLAESTTPKVAAPTLQALALAGDKAALAERLQTQANASRIRTAAAKRIKQAEDAIAADEELIAQIVAVFGDLPEGGASVATQAIKVAVGDVVEYKRTARKEGAEDVTGTATVKGIKATAPVQYKLEAGEGFDVEVFNVFPAQIIRNVTADEAAAAETQGELDV